MGSSSILALHLLLFLINSIPVAGQSRAGSLCAFSFEQCRPCKTKKWKSHEVKSAGFFGLTSEGSGCPTPMYRTADGLSSKSELRLANHIAADAVVQTSPQSGHDSEELAKKLSNPVASLISVPFQSNFDFGMGAGSGWRYTLNIQPVIPVSLNSKWNMISRTILPVIHQHNVVGNGTQSGLGDITQSFFFSPTDSKRFIWAVGPALLIPTATDDALGTKKFGIGPTFLILKQEHAWTYGMLTNHIWSVAGSESRPDVNSTFLQPFLAYNTKDGWTFNLNTESSYDWNGNSWSVPIHFTITKLIKFGQRPVSMGGGLRCWAASPQGGPEECGLRIVVTPLFPK